MPLPALAAIAAMAAVLALATAPAAADDGVRRLAQAAPPAQPAPQPRRTIRPREPRAAAAECAWVGKRAIRVLMRDDLIAAEGFLKVYSAFGCPTRHLGQAFGCAVSGDNGTARDVEERIQTCWTDPARKAQAIPRAPALPPAAKPAAPPPRTSPKAAPRSRPDEPPATTYPKR